MGLFTKSFLDGMYGLADGKEFGNGDGVVTFLELKTYMEREVTYWARRNYGRMQNPQFYGNMKDIFRGDFGESIRFSRPVTIILIERLPTTIELGVVALTIAVMVGIPLGIVSAVKRNSIVDVVTMIIANMAFVSPVLVRAVAGRFRRSEAAPTQG